MNFFGVSPVEIVFIAILGLIIFGPERLPEIGRFLGRGLARVLAWQYTSPEAQLLNELRRDFEQQIIEIRDEMVYARQQLDIRSELTDLQRETEALLRGQTTPPKAVSTTEAVVTPEPTIAPPTALPPAVPVPPPPAPSDTQTSSASVKPAAATLNGTTHSEVETLTQQIQQLSASVQALQEQLRQRGLLDPEWQPPQEVQQEQIA
jgi:sec-independent protein translocase protein TatB